MNNYFEAIKKYRPDVLLLQEGHAKQIEELTASLAKYMGSPYTIYFRTTQRCTSKTNPNKTNFGNAIVSRYRMTDRRFPYLQPQDPRATPPSGGNPEKERILAATIGVGDNKSGNRRLRIYNVHLCSKCTNAVQDAQAKADAVRDSQAKFVLDFIHSEERRLGPKVFTILGGDFNTPPSGQHSAPYVRITKVLLDAWLQGGQSSFDSTNPNGFTESTGAHLQRIDYLFVTKNAGLKVLRAGVIGTEFLTKEREDDPNGLSDHRPVIAYLSVK
jgi:endonuclease/exonuclease/phosphatase family metal-dependent hydrolase